MCGRGGSMVRSARASMRKQARTIQLILSNKKIYYVIVVAILVSLVYIGYWLRMLPMQNYEKVYAMAVSSGVREDVAKYAYLPFNDPWIEYWLADYLHKYGVESWTTLTPEKNNVTKLFWYPWGRDFTTTEYPLIPILGSLGRDPLYTTIMLPVYAGVAGIVIVFILLLFEYGLVAASLASLLLAVLPAATSRTFVGHVEKIGFSIPLLLASLILYMMALKRRRTYLAIASGIAGGFIVSAWGGYAIYGLVLTGTTLLAPLVIPREEEKAYFKTTLYSSASYLVTGLVLDELGYGNASLIYLVAPIIVLAYVYMVLLLLRGTIIKLPRTIVTSEKTVYTLVLFATIVLGILLAPSLGVGGKYYAALLWPLRELGFIDIGLVGHTVAEMASLISVPGGFRDFLAGNGYIAGLLMPIAGLYLLYLAIRHKEISVLPLAVATLGMYYAVLGMAYFEQVTTAIGSLAIAVSTAMLFSKAFKEESTSQKKRKRLAQDMSSRELYMLASGVMIILVLLSGAFGFAYASKSLSLEVATIAGLSRNYVTLGWLHFLQHVKDSLPEDAIVVTWWDYGFWISVGADRPTPVDPATLNETQIKLVARMFTGTEDEANKSLNELYLKPNETYIVIHDFALYNNNTHTLHYVYGLSTDDIRKAWAMDFIAHDGNTERYLEFIRALGASDQAALEKSVNSMLILKMFADAPYHSDKITTFSELPNITIASVQISYDGRTALPLGRQEFKHFEPYMVVITPYKNLNGQLVTIQPGLIPVRIIIVYKWLG